jgi:hypothetical protein
MYINMAYQGDNLMIFGFNTSTYFTDDELKIMHDYNPDIVHIIGISGSELWLNNIPNKNIIECDEISNSKIKQTFYYNLECHAINFLYDHFINKNMYMEAFIALRFLNNDLTKQKKYVLVSISEMVEKLINVINPKQRTIILCPWKIITPSVFGNLITNLNYEKETVKFNKPLCMILNEDDINTHKVSVANLVTEKKMIDVDIYNHLLSILIKIWILENNEKKVFDNFTDTKIFCLNLIMQYLYNNNRINDIYYVWEFYKFDVDINNSDSAYILLYYSKYLASVGEMNDADKYLAFAIGLNEEVKTIVQDVVKEYKKSD